MFRYFEWLKDHHKVAVGSLVVAAVGALVTILALGRDVTGLEFSRNDEPRSVMSPASDPPGVVLPTPTPIPSYMPETPSETPSKTPSTAPETPTNPPETSSEPSPGVRYLDELDADDRNGGYVREPVNMAGKRYLRSVQLSCNSTRTYFVYPVAGMKTLDLWLGIDDQTTGASGRVADLTFYSDAGRQIGSTKTAKLGPAAKVQIPLDEVTQLTIRCVGRELKSGDQENVAHVAFGDAILSAQP
ncbi:hypothetical protein DKT68_11015 [Micromonospora acroterricola]|uniref:Uncharacterized protein n=1 Tax=Micromonospora acroterricola TaxID=2202421 RepID=A0A317DAG9_9ACTN|nr:hypothetical protein DKT68_11015 [Micromonospora acroterricola]